MNSKITIRLSGDKSISHRALMLACVSNGYNTITNLCNGKDVQSTIDCLKACGAIINKKGNSYTIKSNTLTNPIKPLNCGNSGTTMRLLTGLLAGQKVSAVLYGDQSLSKRPMDRVIRPLRKIGADINYINNQIVINKSHINGGEVLNPTSSAQVKSSIILAGLYGNNSTVLTESYNTRDHTEKMILCHSANSIEILGKQIKINPTKLKLENIDIPGDISKASFLIAYACLSPKSDILFENMLVNPRRLGFINSLNKMGANISIYNSKSKLGENVGDIRVKYNGRLKNIKVDEKTVRDMIDEIPILSIVAALSKGVMTISGISELKLKESNRVMGIVSNLRAMGCNITENKENIDIKGQKYLYSTNIKTYSDHRIAMAFHIASFFSKHTMTIDDLECIKISFPDFFKKLNEIIL